MLHQIEPNLYIGDKDAAAGQSSQDFDCIVNVTREIPFSDSFLRRATRIPLRIAVLDIAVPSELQTMFQGCKDYCPLVKRILDRQGKVHVHCSQGKQRSATFITAYLMMTRRMSCSNAIRLLEELYPIAFSDTGRPRFLRCLHALEQEAE